MNALFVKKFLILPLKTILFCICCLSSLLLFSSCSKKTDYFLYVSELRNNLLFYEEKDFYLCVYSVEKEYPYAFDGIAREKTARTEIFLTLPSGNKTCTISFSLNGKNYSGEMSYDNVKAQYYYSCSFDSSTLSEIDFSITYGETDYNVTAQSVITEAVWTPQTLLNKVLSEKPETFERLTDKYGFNGEICLRYIYEECVYCYIGITDRQEKTDAFLINATTGKILASRQS